MAKRAPVLLYVLHFASCMHDAYIVYLFIFPVYVFKAFPIGQDSYPEDRAPA